MNIKKYNSDFTIEVETNLKGIIEGNVTVRNSIIFILNGTISGDLTIEDKSRAIIYGTINGDIHNFGICEIYGTVNGKLFDSNQSILIDENAHINRK